MQYYELNIYKQCYLPTIVSPCSGYLAEHIDLRYFLTFGMMFSGFFSVLFGLGFFYKVHNFEYYFFIQVSIPRIYLLKHRFEIANFDVIIIYRVKWDARAFGKMLIAK